MNAFAAIQQALKSVGVPCVPYLYEGTEPRFITYNYARNTGDDYGDDAPGAVVVAVQVHYFMPIADAKTHAKLNFREPLDRIRTLLFAADFTFPEVNVLREDTTKQWHLVFECEYEEHTPIERM